MNRTHKFTHLFLAFVLIFSLVGLTAVSDNEGAGNVQPVLVEIATTSPDQMVRVIVHRAEDSGRADQFIEEVGGRVLKDLPLIHAFAAEMPAKHVTTLGEIEAVSQVSLDAPMVSTARGKKAKPDGGGSTVDETSGSSSPTSSEPGQTGGELIQQNYFLDTLNVRPVWEMGYRGEGVTVAIIDSGIGEAKDFEVDPTKRRSNSRILYREVFNPNAVSQLDTYGHGTHVAGIIGGSGYDSGGAYAGIAPDVNLIGLKISDEAGLAYESDSVEAMQWVFDHKDEYNIRVVNLSIQSTVEQYYYESALNAAAEILWFNGVVVVASAGNEWSGGYFNTIKAAPANDPFIITVGASNEQGNDDRSDDAITPYTARGFSLSGYYKPEIIAPGKDIVSILAESSEWLNDHPDHFVEGGYFRVSGTSMASPMVAGAAALLLQAEPNLTPDQVKYRLVSTSSLVDYHPYLDVYAALTTPSTEDYNWHVVPHTLLAKMALIAYWASQNGEENIDWGSVDWDAVNWNAVDWDAVNWNAVNWNAVNWNAVNWNAVNWNAVNWNAVNWNAVNWNTVNWNAVNWNAVNWNAVNWN